MTKACRILLAVLVFVLVVAGGAGGVLAAEGTWGPVLLTKDFRGPGFYLSVIKMAACWLLFLAWVKTTDWVSSDCQELKKLDYQQWNPIVFGAFFAAFVLVWLIPTFWIGFPLLVIAYVAPLITYIVRRNALVSNDQRMLTPEHLRFLFATNVGKVGVKVAAVKAAPEEAGSPVKLVAEGGPDVPTNQTWLLAAKQSPGMLAAREVIADALAGRASAIVLDYGQQAAAMRTMIDGVWVARPPRPRETADPALQTLKLLCGLDPRTTETTRRTVRRRI